MKKFNEHYFEEGKQDYEIYHGQYSGAVSEILDFAKKNGYETSDDDVFDQISSGPTKPAEGDTNKFHLDLYKDGEMQKKKLHAQIYGMGNKYELNMYIS